MDPTRPAEKPFFTVNRSSLYDIISHRLLRHFPDRTDLFSCPFSLYSVGMTPAEAARKRITEIHELYGPGCRSLCITWFSFIMDTHIPVLLNPDLKIHDIYKKQLSPEQSSSFPVWHENLSTFHKTIEAVWKPPKPRESASIKILRRGASSQCCTRYIKKQLVGCSSSAQSSNLVQWILRMHLLSAHRHSTELAPLSTRLKAYSTATDALTASICSTHHNTKIHAIISDFVISATRQHQALIHMIRKTHLWYSFNALQWRINTAPVHTKLSTRTKLMSALARTADPNVSLKAQYHRCFRMETLSPAVFAACGVPGIRRTITPSNWKRVLASISNPKTVANFAAVLCTIDRTEKLGKPLSLEIFVRQLVVHYNINTKIPLNVISSVRDKLPAILLAMQNVAITSISANFLRSIGVAENIIQILARGEMPPVDPVLYVVLLLLVERSHLEVVSFDSRICSEQRLARANKHPKQFTLVYCTTCNSWRSRINTLPCVSRKTRGTLVDLESDTVYCNSCYARTLVSIDLVGLRIRFNHNSADVHVVICAQCGTLVLDPEYVAIYPLCKSCVKFVREVISSPRLCFCGAPARGVAQTVTAIHPGGITAIHGVCKDHMSLCPRNKPLPIETLKALSRERPNQFRSSLFTRVRRRHR